MTTTEMKTEMFNKFRKELEYSKSLKDSLMKLISTPEYQKVFEDYIFDVKLKQYVNELATTTAEPLVRKVQTQLTSIGYIQQMLKDIIMSGNNAEHQLDTLSEEEFISYLEEGGE